MGSTSGSQEESVKREKKRTYCRFALEKTRDLDPSSYLANRLKSSRSEVYPSYLLPRNRKYRALRPVYPSLEASFRGLPRLFRRFLSSTLAILGRKGKGTLVSTLRSKR